MNPFVFMVNMCILFFKSFLYPYLMELSTHPPFPNSYVAEPIKEIKTIQQAQQIVGQYFGISRSV